MCFFCTLKLCCVFVCVNIVAFQFTQLKSDKSRIVCILSYERESHWVLYCAWLISQRTRRRAVLNAFTHCHSRRPTPTVFVWHDKRHPHSRPIRSRATTGSVFWTRAANGRETKRAPTELGGGRLALTTLWGHFELSTDSGTQPWERGRVFCFNTLTLKW